MISGHPYINRVYTRETYTESGVFLKKLIIDTRLKNPDSGDHSDRDEWSKLHDYLATLAINNFIDVSSIELRSIEECA